jgi:uncharacterized protein (UPF0332 family)
VNGTPRKLLDKAARSIAAARTLVASGDADFSIARAYYAMFYVAEAMLSTRGLKFRKHGGVHGAFGEQFAKSGEIDAKYHRWLIDAFDRRAVADYGLDAVATVEEASQVIERAAEFLGAAEAHLARQLQP